MLLGAGGAWGQEERVDSTVTWFQERRPNAESLTVIHPQLDVGMGIGEDVVLSVGYSADVVSGATPSLYAAPRAGQSVDAVSGATQFSDVRHSPRGSLTFRGSRSSLTAAYVFGTERDYRSHAVTGIAAVDLPGKNTSFSVSYTHNFDQVCDFDNGEAPASERRALSGEQPCFTDEAGALTVARDLSIDTVQAWVTQNLSPTAVAQLGVYGQIIQGFQSNPYRRVRVAGVDVQESVPRTRGRSAVFGRVRLMFPSLRATVGMGLRGYADTWGVKSGTAEIDLYKYLGPKVLIRLRGRGYQQSGAVFFRDALDYETLGFAGEYATGDKELAPLRSFLFGGKLSFVTAGEDGELVWGLFDSLDFHLLAEGLYTKPLTETPPGGDTTGVLPDAIVASLGLLLRY